MESLSIKTAETHPHHPVIGSLFYPGLRSSIFYCESYEPQVGFWMRNVLDPEDRIVVSVSALGKTFHDVESERPNNANSRMHYWAVEASDTPAEIQHVQISGDAARAVKWSTALFVTENDAFLYAKRFRQRLLGAASCKAVPA